MSLKLLRTSYPLGKSIEVAMFRGMDMVTTKQAYAVCEDGVIVPGGDFEGLTIDEINSLEEYTPTEEKI